MSGGTKYEDWAGSVDSHYMNTPSLPSNKVVLRSRTHTHLAPMSQKRKRCGVLLSFGLSVAYSAAPGCPAAAADVVLDIRRRIRWDNLRPTMLLVVVMADGRGVVTTQPNEGRTAQYNAVLLVAVVVTRKRMGDQGRCVRREKPRVGGLMASSTTRVLNVECCFVDC